jgi:hypothetical protein
MVDKPQHLLTGHLRTAALRLLVLDEVDVLLEQGFKPQVAGDPDLSLFVTLRKTLLCRLLHTPRRSMHRLWLAALKHSRRQVDWLISALPPRRQIVAVPRLPRHPPSPLPARRAQHSDCCSGDSTKTPFGADPRGGVRAQRDGWAGCAA